MFPCSICKKRFSTPRLLKEHARASRNHYPCDYCEHLFRNRQTLCRHVDAKHSPRERKEHSYTCQPCDRSFASQSSLNEHYRGSDSHPSCLKCGKGFQNQHFHDEHQSQCGGRCRTPVLCRSCNMLIQRDERLTHFLDSVNHPTCPKCKVGFVDDRAYEQHYIRFHDIPTCVPGGQQHHDNVSEVQRYHPMSIKHPDCLTQEIESECEEKQQPTHSPEIQFSQPNTPLQNGSSLLPSPIIENEDPGLKVWTSHIFPSATTRTKSSCAGYSSGSEFMTAKGRWLQHGRPLAEMDTESESSSLTLVPQASPIVSGNSGTNTIENDVSRLILPLWSADPPSPPYNLLLSPEVQSPIGLDVLPTISPTPSTPISQSTIAPAHQDPWSQWRSPAEKPVLRPSLPNIATGTSGRPIETVKSSVSTSLARDLVVFGLDKANDSLLNTQAPDFWSPAFKKDLRWNFDHLTNPESTRAPESDHVQPSYHSFQKTVTRPLSTSSSTSTFLNSGSTYVGPTSSTIDSPHSASTIAAVSLHCRLCMRDPCAEPTATMCGHIFCGSCITESVISSPKCPVCQHALLLYCLFKLDLSS